MWVIGVVVGRFHTARRRFEFAGQEELIFFAIRTIRNTLGTRHHRCANPAATANLIENFGGLLFNT